MHRTFLFLSLVSSLSLSCVSTPPTSTPSPSPSPSPSSTPTSTSTPTPTSIVRPPPWLPSAVSYLDARARKWIDAPPKVSNNVPCALSCHTTHPFLLVRPALARSDDDATSAVRAKLEARVMAATSFRDATPMYGAPHSRKSAESLGTEAVLNAQALVMNDAAAGGGLSAGSERALAHLFELQRADGAWEWLDFHLEPWESGQAAMGAAFAALAVGTASRLAPEKLSNDVATRGIEKLTTFLSARASGATALRLHEKALVLWASSRLRGVATAEQRAALAKDFLVAQRADGSWSLATLVGRLPSSEGHAYATGLALLALCEGRPGEDADAIARGVTWLEAHESDDGAFRAKSINVDAPRNHEFMSDAATAYALLALRACAR